MLTPKPVKAWPDSTGKLHATIEEWRVAEMQALLRETDGSGPMDEKALELLAADLATTQAERLLAILTTGPRSRPAARKRAGTTNPKRATKQQASDGFKAMREAVEAPAQPAAA